MNSQKKRFNTFEALKPDFHLRKLYTYRHVPYRNKLFDWLIIFLFTNVRYGTKKVELILTFLRSTRIIFLEWKPGFTPEE